MDTLVYAPVDEWVLLQSAMQTDWPRCLPGNNLLQTQRLWLKNGFNYGFNVYCPYGDASNGMLAVVEQELYTEITIQCPSDDTTKLEEALKNTKVIKWESVALPHCQPHVVECFLRILPDLNLEIEHMTPTFLYVLEKNTPKFEDIVLPPGFTVGPIFKDNVDLIDSTWPHRYPNSTLYFGILIDTKSGLGLYKDGKLVSWVFIGESGFLTHMYTIKEYRRMGLGELLLKTMCNMMIKDKRDVLAFCVKENVMGCKLHEKVGFVKCNVATWCYFKEKQ